jgi:hypothetical protein
MAMLGKRRKNDEKNEQQEYQVGHGCHARRDTDLIALA